jgi:hypothetical protein
MPQFTSGYDFDTGQLNAAQQGDALSGMEGVGGGGGGADFGGLVGTILGERRRKEQQTLAEQRRQEQLQERARQRQEAMMRDQQRQGRMEQQRQEAMARDEPFQKMRTAKALETGFGRNKMNLSTMIGGPQASHFQDYAARMAGMQAAGVPIYDYTGMKDIVAGNAGASQAAVGEAGANLRQQREQQFNASPAGMQYAALNRR